MTSNRIWFLVLVPLFLLSSCTDFLSGKANKDTVVKFQVVDNSCASQFSDQVKNILDTTASDQDIDGAFSCIQSYMTQFQNRVNGEEEADVYKVSDLLHITSRFFKKQNLDQESIEGLLKLKTALVGGKDNALTKDEVKKMKSFLHVLNKEFLNVYRYSYVLHKTPAVPLKREELQVASEQLKISLRNVLSVSQMWNSNFNFEDAINLLLKLKVINTDDLSNVELIRKVKQLITGGQELKLKTDFIDASESFVKAAYLYMLSDKHFVKFEIKTVEGLDDSVHFFDALVDTLESTLQYKKTSEIETKDIDQVFEVLLQRKILPFSVQYETFRDFYKVVLARVFASHPSDQVEPAQKITATTFSVYKKESSLFKLHLDFIKNIKTQFNPQGFMSIESIKAQLNQFFSASQRSLSVMALNTYDRIEITNSFKAQTEDMLSVRPRLISQKKYILSTGANVSLNEEDLLREVYVKMLTRELFLGWGNYKSTKSLKTSVLTESQFVNFYSEFKPFGIELKLNDPRSKNNGSISFLESNLFSFSADGNDLMSWDEGQDYVHYLIGDGAWSTDALRKGLATAGCNIAELDVFGHPMNQYGCVFKEFRRNYKTYWSNKPGLVQFLSKLNDQDFFKYFNDIMLFSVFDSHQYGKKVETVDLQTFTVISSYIETMFVQFDTNKNTMISALELKAAYPKFKNFVENYTRKNMSEHLEKWKSPLNHCRLFYSEEDLIREAFFFILLNDGKEPVMDDINYVTCSVNGIFTHDKEMNRKSVLKAFIKLKSVLTSN